MQTIENEKAEYQRTCDKRLSDMQKIEDKLSSQMSERQKLQVAVTKAAEKVARGKQCIAEKEKEIEGLRGDADNALKQAETYTRNLRGDEVQVPIKVGKDKDYVTQKIKVLTQRKEKGLASRPEDQRDPDVVLVELQAWPCPDVLIWSLLCTL